MDDKRVEGVLDVGTRVGRVEEALGIRVDLGEQQRRRALAVEPPIAKLRMKRRHDARAVAAVAAVRWGFSAPGHQAHVLPNHRVGNR